MIIVNFKNQKPIRCNIIDTELGQRYQQLVEENYKASFPIYRDVVKYNEKYLRTLAKYAAFNLGWDWDPDSYTIENSVMFHKDLEVFLNRGFDQIPAELDDLMHELHYCLHLVQFDTDKITRDRSWLQIEWFNDNGFTLTDTSVFQKNLYKGDLKLQNPFVGHGPAQIDWENDYTNISQTCKFHDYVKPGINISTHDIENNYNKQDFVKKFLQADRHFYELHGPDKIWEYTGYPVIGKVENLEDLYTIIHTNEILELESLEFE